MMNEAETLPPEPVILLSCGSFNPITVMHLRMMELARDKVERTWSIPPTRFQAQRSSSSGSPGQTHSEHKPHSWVYSQTLPKRQIVVGGIFSPVSDGYNKRDLAASSVRVELLRLACQFNSDWLAVDPWEALQPNWTRTRLVADCLQARLDQIFVKLNELECSPFGLHEQLCVDNTPTYLGSSPMAQSGLVTESWLTGRLSQVTCQVSDFEFHTLCCAREGAPNVTYPVPADPSSTSLQRVRRLRYPRTRIKLVFGADVLQSFAVPDLWSEDDMETLVRDYGIICISRPGSDPASLIQKTDMLRKHEDNIILVTDLCENKLSATMVRNNIKSGSSIRYLVPDAVLEKIYAEGMYGAKKTRRLIPNHLC
ncbi:hypothetical protein CRM22_004661 [Opisthorchis felineus]|uniref:Nicotinamide-nucleotide adenylyltransferase n=1 Tax=Opisthorchis felineus TaxID=147828 RepID=A0A4S2LV15_OPIFE|nr:hypothetical protein CRM22_004661 [Opisthorchis felineus]